jgi:hypothetical protein
MSRRSEALKVVDPYRGGEQLKAPEKLEPLTCETCRHGVDIGKSFAKCGKSNVMAANPSRSYLPDMLPDRVREGLAAGLCPEWNGIPPEDRPTEYVRCANCTWSRSYGKCGAPQVAGNESHVERKNQTGDCLFYQSSALTRLLRLVGLRKPVVR